MDFSLKKLPGMALASVLALAIPLANCKKDDDDNSALALLALGGGASCSSTLDSDITADTTISGNVCLSATVFVRNGATLTVAPGTTVLGSSGTAIFVLNGSKLNAIGTAAQPIVFTSINPVGSRAPGDWGGILIIGNAPTARTALGLTEGTDKQPYGFSATENAADNSGTLQYVRVEFAGTKLATGDELNGISLYAVGSGTTVDHVQVHMGKDDNIEIFGGRVNVSYLVSTAFGDDGVDIDEGYQGTLSNVLVYAYPAGSGIAATGNDPRSFELDGTKSSTGFDGADPSTFTITKFTSVGETPPTEGLKIGGFRDNVQVTMSKGVFLNYSSYVLDGANSDCGACGGAVSLTWSNVSMEGAAYTGDTDVIETGTPTMNANQATYLTSKWSINNPTVAPVFAVNVPNSAFEGETTDWTSGWTNWRNN